jgi:hypothetical protein
MAQADAQRFSLRHKGWIYTIPDWKAKSLLMSQADLLEDKEKPAEAKAETPQAMPTLPAAALTAEPNQPK